ncbi:Aste57867_991 [Aphanomyces stellatus]|uniref:Carbonic anhydrase n=1 Tax=Aphanomyces stellatus TaxID=120398 RepID=A0A485K420_9STRA|nr:hypothetical protein As57867_000990 [Aphanomyces stellatus]VFT78213.1 Aste57867_991 [Aphanomyces stellatus]
MKVRDCLVALTLIASIDALHHVRSHAVDSNECQQDDVARQSPIDLPGVLAAEANQGAYAWTLLDPTTGTVTRLDDTIKTFWAGGSEVALHGCVYSSVNFHHHAPSEHTIDGRHFDLELHFVHSNDAGHLAAVGVFFDVDDDDDAPNPFLDQFVPGFGLLKNVHDNFTLPLVSAQGIGFETSNVFRYEGSLTTPPYTEGVAWSVLTEVQSISSEQLEAFKHVIDEANSRPTQCTNGRDIALVQTV